MKKVFEMIIEKLEEKENESILKAPNTGDFNNKDYQKWMMKSFGFKESMKIVQEVAEEYNGGWISCSERLPKAEVKEEKAFKNGVKFASEKIFNLCNAMSMPVCLSMGDDTFYVSINEIKEIIEQIKEMERD